MRHDNSRGPSIVQLSFAGLILYHPRFTRTMTWGTAWTNSKSYSPVEQIAKKVAELGERITHDFEGESWCSSEC